MAAKRDLPPWLRAITGKFDEGASGQYRPLVTTIRSGTRLAHSLGLSKPPPRAEIKAILDQVSTARKRWQTLDH